MSLIDSVKNIFRDEKEPFEASLRNVVDLFRNRKEEEIEEALDCEERLVKSTERKMERLDDALEELQDYSDKDSIKAVEDVAENFYRDRKRLVSDFESGDGIEEHLDALKEFIDEFNDVSRKEGVVMKRIENSSGSLSDRIQEVIDHRDEVSDFIDTDYSPLYSLREIKDAVNEIEDVEERIERKKNDLDKLSLKDKEQELAGKKDELDQLKSSDEWQEKENLEQSIEDLKQEKKDLEASISSDIAGLERGLKKLVYELDNSDLEFEGDREVLESLKNGSTSVEPDGELEEASGIIQDNSILEGRQLSKFTDAVEKLDNLGERLSDIQDLEEELEDKKSTLREIEIEDERDRLSSEIERIGNELEKKKGRREKLEDEVEDLEQEKKSRIEHLEVFISEALDVEASIHETNGKKHPVVKG